MPDARPPRSASTIPAIARKVESEVFRDQELSKGAISVNVEYGVVYLRGEVPDREQMDALVDRTRKVDGVRGVENLTHLPNEAAPTKDEASQGAASRAARATRRAPRGRR